MIRLCEIIGLTTYEMAELTGYVMALIVFGVFIGICMHDIFDFAVYITRELLTFVWKLIRKHFPNVRKRR